ncbi:hypothetical protein COLO4_10655 [Corchorus olitorius]|uniref:BHLH domain-containing protein n=1 Tax=Corchorus olitorius TaxID=93759 RepID=A0A1R3K7F6_9ROSI|nr:hypothetical protein COLO4_10655 [Corchorus olitorius]
MASLNIRPLGLVDYGETVKVDGKGSEQKTNTNRSKHSETEQRRRSKINERFQTLRDLIPQNDQKRDKASFLLERNHQGLAESFIDHCQVMKNGTSCENNVAIPSMLANTQNSIESDLGNAAVFKALDHPPGSATSMVNMQSQSNTFATHGRGGIPTQSFHESASESENAVYRPQFQWQSRECLTEAAVPNNSANELEDLTIRGDTGLSSAYSQG